MKSVEAATYFAFYVSEFSVGVHQKVLGTVKALRANNITADLRCYSPSLRELFRFLIDFIICKDDLIFVRYSDFFAPFLCFIGCYHRLRGRVLIVDVPTPRKNSLSEIKLNISNPITRSARQLLCIFNGSWVLWPASLVVQYSEEGRWFDFLVREKTLLMGNPIDTHIPVTIARNWCLNSELRLVVVAQFAEWHGVDRMLRAFSVLRDEGYERRIHLDLVGDGPAMPALLEDIRRQEFLNVKYHGVLKGRELDSLLASCHIGVSSLGLYRVGLNIAGVLKTREYLVRGLPVLGCGRDPDFDPTENVYRYVVSNDDSVDEIVTYLLKILTGNIQLPQAAACREFAMKHFGFDRKLKKIFDCL